MYQKMANVASEKIFKKFCQKWDSNPRPHSWTRTLCHRTDCIIRQGIAILESGALDHSAILTTDNDKSWYVAKTGVTYRLQSNPSK